MRWGRGDTHRSCLMLLQSTHMVGTLVLQCSWNLYPHVWQRKPFRRNFWHMSQYANFRNVFLTLNTNGGSSWASNFILHTVLSNLRETHKVVGGQRNVIENLHQELLSDERRRVRVPVHTRLFTAIKEGKKSKGLSKIRLLQQAEYNHFSSCEFLQKYLSDLKYLKMETKLITNISHIITHIL